MDMRGLVIADLIEVCWDCDLDFYQILFPIYLARPLPELALDNGSYEWVGYSQEQLVADLDSLSDSDLLELYGMIRKPRHEWWMTGRVELYLIETDQDLADLFDLTKPQVLGYNYLKTF